MPRETDLFWKHVKLLPNKHWNCNFCGKPYAGSATRIKAHLAGVGGYGINDCKDVDGQVRLEARKAMKGKGVAELSNGAESNVEDSPHLPVTVNDDDALRETSFAAMPHISSDVTSIVGASSSGLFLLPDPSILAQIVIPPQTPQYHAGDSNIQLRNLSYPINHPNLALEALTDMPAPVNAEGGELNTEVLQGASSSSAFLPLNEINVHNQYLPTQNMTTHGDFSPWTQPPQSHAGDSNIQLWNLSYGSSRGDLAREALTNVPRLVNAGEGGPNTEIPQGASSSSAFLPLNEINVHNQYLPTQNMTTHGDFSPWTQPPQSHAGDSNIQLWNLSYGSSSRGDLAHEALTNVPRLVNAGEGGPNTEVPQGARTEDAVVVSRPGNGGLVNKNVPSLRRKRKEQSNREVVNNFRCSSFQKLSTTTRCRKNLPVLKTELVGKESERAIEKICNYLMGEEIVIVGIYGMGGVGKTAILMHVHNRILENPAFDDAFWVTVPQEFTVYELQNKIANAVGLDNLSKYKDVKRRAPILNRHLKSKRAVLCLDGLWMHFDIEDVGIPVEKGSIKLVMTTRSLDVCDRMVCQKQVEISPLDLRDDCWVLFLEKLCFGRDLPSEVKKIASSILDKCGGLPLGIIEIATQMRGPRGVHEWKDLLQQLENSTIPLNVFKELKLTYMNLGNLQVQQCFLHLILCFGEYFSEDEIIKKVLIESFIDEGLLSGIATRQELHNKGNTILDKIKRACLGFNIDRGRLLVHPLTRDMALQIVTSTTHMVKANMGLKEIPKEEFWTDHLEKVFLQSNYIQEIPDGISPNCPKLMRLSLNDNVSLEAIHKSFFRHIKGLKVLDLSKTKIMELPDTISDLESLEALSVRGCEELRCVPSVRKLGSLKKLDMSGCTMLEEVPEGMEMLVKLTYLDLHSTKIETLPEGVLWNLVNLQYLVIKKVTAKEEEEEEEEEEIKLTKVEGFYCSVPNVETFNVWVRLLKQNSSRPYELWLNELGDHSFRNMHEMHIIIKSCHSVAVGVDGEIGGDGRALLPKNVQVLEVGRCDGVTSLCEVGPLDNLDELEIKEWENLEELGAVHFPNLRRLTIIGCSKLKHLLKGGHELERLQWFKIEGSEELEEINIAAPFLYNIEVYRCPKMKWVVKWPWLATRLPNLRSIKIKNCEQLEEIVCGLPPIGAISRLTKIETIGCKNLNRVRMMPDMLLHLPFLQDVMVQDVMVEDCMGIEAIIGTVSNMTQPSFSHFTDLTLQNLPELKSICEGTMSCLSIQYMNIAVCPKLKRLTLLDYSPRNDIDKRIDRLTWQSLERDQFPFRSSLQHLAMRYGVSNWHDQRICVRIESCDTITAMVDGLIGGDGRNSLPRNVQVLEVGGGSWVTSLSEVGPLENLEELTINRWEKLEELGAVHFPHLRKLNITYCSELKCLLVEGQGLPRLNFVEVRSCDKMKRVVEWDQLTTRLPNLKSIKIIFCDKLEEIIGGPLPIGATCLLTKIQICGCHNMKGVLLTDDMLLHIPFLQDIRIQHCKGIKVIIGTAPNMTQPSFPKLTRLTLWDLPKLKRICDWMESCDHILYIEIYDCPKLKRIPLRLHPLDNGLLSPPPSLGQIVKDEETWQALEWDHPLARVSLEPFIKFYDLWSRR